jgi:hypothetical protein
MRIGSFQLPFHDEPEAEQKFGFVRGWRFWTFVHPHYLGDINRASIWTPRKRNVAFCRAFHLRVPGRSEPHKVVPFESCTCGFHAYNEAGIAKVGVFHGLLFEFQAPIFGEVALWGKVIRHARGYRAEFAYPIRLWVLGPVGEASIEEVASAYGVPVRPIDEADDPIAQKVYEGRKECSIDMFPIGPGVWRPFVTGRGRQIIASKPFLQQQRLTLHPLRKSEGKEAPGPFVYNSNPLAWLPLILMILASLVMAISGRLVP